MEIPVELHNLFRGFQLLVLPYLWSFNITCHMKYIFRMKKAVYPFATFETEKKNYVLLSTPIYSWMTPLSLKSFSTIFMMFR